ncbi:MAG: MFS transporter [Anaerolineales bacterium]|jgi:predicted MFS family arabinose efflux permease
MKRDFTLVLISLTIWGIGESAFYYFQPLYLEQLGASPLVIGGILGAMGLAMTLVHIPAGYLADRIGRRELMWAAWGMGILTTGIMAAARSLAFVAAGVILYSLTVFVIAPLNSYATAARGGFSVEQAMTTTTAGYYLGGIIGPLIGGFLADLYGLRSIYLFALILFILSTLIILFIRPQPVEQKSQNPAGNLIRNRSFVLFLPYLFLVYLALFLPQPLAPNFLQNQRGITLQTIGSLGSISNLGIVVLNLTFGQIPSQLGLILGQLFVGAFTVLIWKSTKIPVIGGAYFLLGGFRAIRSLLIAQVQKLVSSSNLGLAYGISETVSGLAMAAAPPLAGALYAADPESIFKAAAILIGLTLLVTITRRKISWMS